MALKRRQTAISGATRLGQEGENEVEPIVLHLLYGTYREIHSEGVLRSLRVAMETRTACSPIPRRSFFGTTRCSRSRVVETFQPKP